MISASKNWAARSKPDHDALGLVGMCSLILILPLLAVYTVGAMLGSPSLGEVEIRYYGYLRSLLDVVLAAYIAVKISYLGRSSALTRVIIMWTAWVVVTSLLWGTDGTMMEYFLEELVPAIIWPLAYLYFFVLGRAAPSVFCVIVPYFGVLAIGCGALAIVAFYLSNQTSSLLLQQSNEVYYSVLLVPWIMMIPWRFLKVAGLFAVLTIASFALKRGALFATAAACVTYVVALTLTRKRKIWGSLAILVATCALGVGTILWIDEGRGGQLLSRVDSLRHDEGSGRVEIYLETIAMIKKSRPVELIFGHGLDRVVADSVLGVSAHNDWLECLYDFGLVGLVLFAGIHVALIRQSISLFRSKSRYAPRFLAAYILFLLVTAYSHLVIYPWYCIFVMSFFGYVTGASEATKVQLVARAGDGGAQRY